LSRAPPAGRFSPGHDHDAQTCKPSWTEATATLTIDVAVRHGFQPITAEMISPQ
jgi:hypothetical protein